MLIKPLRRSSILRACLRVVMAGEHRGIRSILFLKQCGVRQVPAGFVRRVDQPTVEMRRMIGRTIEMGAVPARFMMQEPASGMIPEHQAIIEQEMAVSGRRHPVLVGGASQRSIGRQSG